MTGNCFSESNFDLVFQYLESKLISGGGSYMYNKFKVSLTKEKTIIIHYNSTRIANISRVNGIAALAILKSDNKKQLAKANEIFCWLTIEAGRKD